MFTILFSNLIDLPSSGYNEMLLPSFPLLEANVAAWRLIAGEMVVRGVLRR
jgi:hypothetical protein